jgi:hypothetical protein
VKPLPKEQITINLHRLLLEQITEVLTPAEQKEEGPSKAIRDALEIYVDELQRRYDKRPVNLEMLPNLKHGIRRASIYVEWANATFPDELAGWHPGAKSENLVQFYVSICHTIMRDLTLTVSGIEWKHPEMADEFRAEREAYYASVNR